MYFNNSLLCKTESSSATKSFFIRNTHKKLPLHQVLCGKTPNAVLNRMLELFLKVSPLKKILEFQNQKKDYKTWIKQNRELKIEPMIENL